MLDCIILRVFLKTPKTLSQRTMGNLFTKLSALLTSLFSTQQREAKIVMVGLANAGKTATLYRVHSGDSVSTQPTMGSNVEELVFGNLRLQCWDLGGQDTLRETWAAYFANTDGVVLVVDSSDRRDLEKVKFELRKLLINEDLKDAPLLVLANKQDVKGAMTPAELSTELALHDPSIRRALSVQGSCAVTGDGLFPGFEWLASTIISNQQSKAG